MKDIAHAGLIGILAGRIDFAQNVERPVGLDLDADMRLADIALLQPGGDGLRERRRGQPARPDRTGQRHIHVARGIDEIGIAHALLSEHRDPHPVAGIEGVDRARAGIGRNIGAAGGISRLRVIGRLPARAARERERGHKHHQQTAREAQGPHERSESGTEEIRSRLRPWMVNKI